MKMNPNHKPAISHMVLLFYVSEVLRAERQTKAAKKKTNIKN